MNWAVVAQKGSKMPLYDYFDFSDFKMPVSSSVFCSALLVLMFCPSGQRLQDLEQVTSISI
jgi:hypothetical protein